MPLDIFNHFLPEPVFRRFRTLAPHFKPLEMFEKLPELWSIDHRLESLSAYENYQQILSLSNPPIEMLGNRDETPAIARFANDALAQTCQDHRARFPGFIANLPMNNVPASLAEIDRVISQLGACGIQIYTNVNGRPLSAPEFLPVFATMAERDLPVWIHPMRGPMFSDYAAENASENEIYFTFGWPYETSAAVTRLIFSGIYDKLPRLKLITHHMGGMIPYFSEKISIGFTQIFEGAEGVNPLAVRAGLKRPLLDYYHMLYADTATNGSRAATVCGHAFFGTDQLLFASDAPFDYNGGRKIMTGCLDAVDALPIPVAERAAIFQGNARALLKLT